MLYLIRGLPGAGKTNLSIDLRCDSVEADHFFQGENGYVFNPRKLGEAHAWCQARCRELLSDPDIQQCTVANTFTQRWELEPYLQMAAELGSDVIVIDLFDGGCTDEQLFARNVHGVPMQGITQMRARYEHCWRTGDPTPPWER